MLRVTKFLIVGDVHVKLWRRCVMTCGLWRIHGLDGAVSGTHDGAADRCVTGIFAICCPYWESTELHLEEPGDLDVVLVVLALAGQDRPTPQRHWNWICPCQPLETYHYHHRS